jgi:hypothetical protein
MNHAGLSISGKVALAGRPWHHTQDARAIFTESS